MAILAIFLELVVEAPFALIEHWAKKAAERNAKEFEAADPNSMNAWNHFPW